MRNRFTPSDYPTFRGLFSRRDDSGFKLYDNSNILGNLFRRNNPRRNYKRTIILVERPWYQKTQTYILF
jgi:uncharacterized protein YxjI